MNQQESRPHRQPEFLTRDDNRMEPGKMICPVRGQSDIKMKMTLGIKMRPDEYVTSEEGDGEP